MLTQQFVQSLLCLGFGMAPTYVVPRQGNWFNVQDYMKEGYKVDTWCAYKIKDSESLLLPFYDAWNDGTGNRSMALMTSTIDVQLVGKSAEYGVLTMAHWGHRADIQDFLAVSGMALVADGLGDYIVSDFYQDGANKVLSFNASFDVLWYNDLLTTQQLLTIINLPSGVVQTMVSGNLTLTY
jgi:hypothetical protein